MKQKKRRITVIKLYLHYWRHPHYPHASAGLGLFFTSHHAHSLYYNPRSPSPAVPPSASNIKNSHPADPLRTHAIGPVAFASKTYAQTRLAHISLLAHKFTFPSVVGLGDEEPHAKDTLPAIDLQDLVGGMFNS